MREIIRTVLGYVLIILIVVCMLAVSALADTSTVTFTNQATNQPDLFITKSVTCAVDGYTIPDIDFTFQVKWDLDGTGKLSYASNEIYTVYSEDGTQVYETDNDGNNVVLRTDAAGRFTIKAGQTAKFEYVGVDVQYEITEVKIPDNWIQTTPGSGSSATGLVAENGTMVSFENTYIPESTTTTLITEDGEDPTTTLSVTKQAVGVGGNSYDTDELFTFMVYIADSPWANKNYTVYDLSSGDEVSTGITDDEGKFQISGNQKAVFEDVTLYEDYAVSEEDIDGWTLLTDQKLEDGTVYPIVYTSFTNRIQGGYISLIKINESNEPIANAVFGVYSDENCSNLLCKMTSGSDGTVTSSELDPGTYYVREITTPTGYALSSEIYEVEVKSNETTSVGTDGKVVNSPLGGILYLNKLDKDNDSGLENAEFGVYSDEGCETLIEKIMTDETGYAESIKLDTGTYYVKEITAPDDYLRSDAVYKVVIDENSDYVAIGDDNGNIFNTKEDGSITLIKKDGNGNKLTGVKFEMRDSDDNLIDTLTTDSSGKVTFTGLTSGSYTITEVETVNEQTLLSQPFTIRVPVKMTQDEVDTIGSVDTDEAYKLDGNYYFYNLTYEVTNNAKLVIPESGGPGYMLGIVGILIIIAVCVYALIDKENAKGGDGCDE